MIEAFKEITVPHFNRSWLKCLWRARRVPDVIYSDRGPEMISAVAQEFMTLCNSKQYLGAAYTPRHQGAGERGHQEPMMWLKMLLNEVCSAFPQEWSELLPVVEFLMHTDIGEHAFRLMSSRLGMRCCKKMMQ